MSKLQIVRLGHPSLRVKSKTVHQSELKKPDVQKFFDDLIEACLVHEGVGIAAPQVGVNRRVIVVNITGEALQKHSTSEFPATIVVNPKVSHRSEATEEDWEGDLSFDLRAWVARPTSCIVRGWDRQGAPVEYKLSGFPARVFQHEIDHLDGVLFLDRVKHPETIGEIDMWQKFWLGRDPKQVLARGQYDFPV
jgi:peptide deformylase